MSDATNQPSSPDTVKGKTSDDLIPLVYEELRHIARAQLARQPNAITLQPTALVHEVWLKISKRRDNEWNDREHFFRTAIQAMRQILVDKSRLRASQKRGQNAVIISLDNIDIPNSSVDEKILLIDEALKQIEQENPENARLITLKIFAGYTTKELSQLLNTSHRSIARRWNYCQARMIEIIEDMEKI